MGAFASMTPCVLVQKQSPIASAPRKTPCGLKLFVVNFLLSAAAPRKGASPGGRSSGAAQTQKPCSRSRYVPWRAAARAGRQR